MNLFKTQNKKYALALLQVIFAWSCLNAQLTVNQQTAQPLVQNVLLGNGVSANNITFTGSAQMLGGFNGANSNIGLSNGIILSTGRIQDATGPNQSSGSGENLSQNGFVPLEQTIGDGAETQDAAILKFNFICEGDVVQFRYVFASEEYPEYVGSEFNDAFAFFIQGPGITGMQNIALIPGTNQPVAINNVNAGENQSFFVNNGNGSTNGGQTVEFDGFTRPLIAKANVIPCEQYTITIVIADVSDGIYDSAVFLEGQSFTSPEVEVKGQISYVDGASELYENCGNMTITVSRTGETTAALTVPLYVEGTATMGADYNNFPTTVTIPAGQSSVSFTIAAVQDGINEPGGETVAVIYRDTGCVEIVEKRVDFTIFDPPPPVAVNPGLPQEKKCPRVPVELNALVTGGVQPYIISWENSLPNQNPVTVFPDSSMWYTVTITDQCGAQLIDSSFIEIKDYIPLRLYVTPDTILCKGDAAEIRGFSTGGKLPISFSWETPGIFGQSREVSPQQTTIYKISVTDSCQISVTKSITVKVIEVNAVFNVNYLDHSTVQFTDLSFTDVVQWDWDFGDNSGISELQNPVYTFPDTGLFFVTLIASNEDACKDTVVNPIFSYPPFNMWIPNTFTPDGDGINDAFAAIGEGFVSYEMYIFNRWGEQIFQTDSYALRWGDGQRGILDNIPIDVYSYKIIARLPTLETRQFIGRVTVIR